MPPAQLRYVSSSEALAEARWLRSSHSTAANNCVETAGLRSGLAVRDSKNPQGPALLFATAAWKRFLGVVVTGTG